MGRLPRPRGAFADPAFRRLFGASAFSFGGHQVTVLALPALALAVTDATAGQISAMFFWTYLVPLFVSPVAGSLADRRSGVATLLLADVLRLGALAFLGLVGLTGTIDIVHIWVVAGILGGGNTAFDIGTQAVIPRIVEISRLPDANTNIARARALADTAGPGSAGPLVQWVGPAGALVFDACTYIASMYLVLRLRRVASGAPLDAPAEPDHDHAAPGQALPHPGRLRPAARFLFGQRALLLMMLSLMLLNGGGAILGALFVPFAVDFAGVPFGALGIAAGIGNTGLVVGAAMAARVSRRFGYVRSAALSGIGSIGALWLFAAAGFGPAPALMFGLYHFVFGVTAVTFGVASSTFRQTVTPDAMQGSVYGVMRTMMLLTPPLGVGVGSAVTHYISIEVTIIASCVVSSLAFLFLVLLFAQPEPEGAGSSVAGAPPAA